MASTRKRPTTRRAVMSEEDKRAAAEAAAQRVDELHDLLAVRAVEMASGTGWSDWLRFQSAFRSYSASNSMLIFMQRPTATRVMGYGARDASTGWLSLGRNVRKGETGIKILAPVIVKIYGEPNGKGRWEHDAKGWFQRRVVRFKIVTVFDVEQTEGKDLPVDPGAAWRLTGGADTPTADRLRAGLETLITEQGWTYDYAATDDGSDGWANHTKRHIRVADHLAPAQQIRALAHECAHLFMHDDHAVYVTNRARCEVEADSVAAIILLSHGLDEMDAMVTYSLGWANGDAKLIIGAASKVVEYSNKILTILSEQADHKTLIAA